MALKPITGGGFGLPIRSQFRSTGSFDVQKKNQKNVKKGRGSKAPPPGKQRGRRAPRGYR